MAAVCRAWRDLLSGPGPLWEAAVFMHVRYPEREAEHQRHFLSHQRWLRTHGPRLRQLQYGWLGASVSCQANCLLRCGCSKAPPLRRLHWLPWLIACAHYGHIARNIGSNLLQDAHNQATYFSSPPCRFRPGSYPQATKDEMVLLSALLSALSPGMASSIEVGHGSWRGCACALYFCRRYVFVSGCDQIDGLLMLFNVNI